MNVALLVAAWAVLVLCLMTGEYGLAVVTAVPYLMFLATVWDDGRIVSDRRSGLAR